MKSHGGDEMRNYKDYDVWRKSHVFAVNIYKATTVFPKDEMYGLRSQIRRAATSIPTNIAEGAARKGDKQFARFLDIAFASANETEYLLTLTFELEYIEESDFSSLSGEIDEIIKMIRSLINRLKQ